MTRIGIKLCGLIALFFLLGGIGLQALQTDSSVTLTETARTVYLDNGTIRVGVDKVWGGAIREIWHRGANVINHYDGGRLIGISVYDGADPYNQANIHDPNNWGWNPTPSDKYDHRNRPIDYRLDGDTFYVKSRNLHWNPDDKGGGRFQAVPSDLIVETWLSFPPDHPTVLKARFRATYEGEADHAVSSQEFPFAYVNPGYHRIVAYTGNAPWTGAPAETDAPGRLPASEGWVAFVNGADMGLTLYAPFHYPLITGSRLATAPPPRDDTNYLLPFLPQAYAQGSTFETTVFYVAGDWRAARETIAALRQDLDLSADIAPPHGTLDVPHPDAVVSGRTTVAGWAIDDVGIERVEVWVDGERIGEADYGSSRPDVARDYPGLPSEPNFGFQYALDTADLSPGPHEITIRLVDEAGNPQALMPRRVTVD